MIEEKWKAEIIPLIQRKKLLVFNNISELISTHGVYLVRVEHLTPHEMTASTLSKLKSRMSDRHEK